MRIGSIVLVATAVHLAGASAASTSFAQSHDASPLPALPPSPQLPPLPAPPQGAAADDVVPTAPAAAPAPKPLAVLVHVDGPDGVILQQDVTNDDDWQTVCSAPCDKLLSTAFYYRIAGAGLKASGDFALHAQPGAHETLIVDGASKGSFALGIVALAAGIVAAYVGLIVVDVGFLQSSVDGGGGSDNGTVGAGVAVMGVGAVAALGGLLLTIANSRTKVKQFLGGDSSGLLPPGSWTRTPPWSASLTAPKGLSPTIGIPILSGRF